MLIILGLRQPSSAPFKFISPQTRGDIKN